MTLESALEAAIAALTDVMRTCRDYGDLDTARIAHDAQIALIRRRSEQQIKKMEAARGLV